MSARYQAQPAFATGREEIRVLIPKAKRRPGERREARARRATRYLWSRGIYPSPAAMGLRLYGYPVRSLSGIETAVRNEILCELGIPRQRQDARFVTRLPQREVKP